jgi:hypothetical protein
MLQTRRQLIQRIQRLIYNDYPEQAITITEPLINLWINDAIGAVVKNNYVESIKLDGVAYINNAFYSTFKDIVITQDEPNLYKFTLPNIPIGIGVNEGIATVEFKDENNNISYPAIPLTMNQVGYQRGMRTIPNKVLYWNENSLIYAKTSIPLNLCKAIVRMISGSNSDSLDSVLNVPSDYMPQIIDYVVKYLMIERNNKQDLSNDLRDEGNKN